MMYMHPKSMFSIRHWKLPEILFVASACFALAAAGFFIAVFLQLHSAQTQAAGNTTKIQNDLNGLSPETKRKLAEGLGSTSSSASTSSTSSSLNASDKNGLTQEEKTNLSKGLGY
jgi:hypothetical protein